MSFDRKGFSHSREVLFVLLRRLCFESSNWKFAIQGDRAKCGSRCFQRALVEQRSMIRYFTVIIWGGTFDDFWISFHTVCTFVSFA